jgi:hypothetical protein
VEVVNAAGKGLPYVSCGFNETFIGKEAIVTGVCTKHLTLQFEDTGNGWEIDSCDVTHANSKPRCAFTPQGTYAERQKQWIEHFNVKEGDKVKVVKEFERNEDGLKGSMWDYSSDKAKMQNGIFEIQRFESNSVKLWTKGRADWWCFPYFALEPVK